MPGRWSTESRHLDALVQRHNTNGIKTLGTVPRARLGGKGQHLMQLPRVHLPPPARKWIPGGECGNGIYPMALTAVQQQWMQHNRQQSWRNQRLGAGAHSARRIRGARPGPMDLGWRLDQLSGQQVRPRKPVSRRRHGVAIYDLDNEPSWWDAETLTCILCPSPMTKVTNGGIGTASPSRPSIPLPR